MTYRGAQRILAVSAIVIAVAAAVLAVISLTGQHTSPWVDWMITLLFVSLTLLACAFAVGRRGSGQ